MQISKMIKIITISCLVMFGVTTVSYAKHSEKGFVKWQKKFYKKAKKEGIKQETLDAAFAGVKFSKRYVRQDKKQFKKKTFAEYYNNMIDKRRVVRAQYRIKRFRTLLGRVEKKFKVPPRYLVALWGIESDFGKGMGNYSVISALSNLAYEGRRKSLFESELLSALRMIQDGKVTPEEFKGSWAGAMGQCQFMPSTYLKYAVDFNEDGKKDIWHSKHDVFASIANYLGSIGWQHDLPWGYEVKINGDKDLAKSFHSREDFDLKTLSDLGVVRKDSRKFTKNELDKKVNLITYDDRYFVTFSNFKKLKIWNNSNYFALTVGMLAEQL